MPTEESKSKINRRLSQRVVCKDTIVVNPQGACEVIDLSKLGFSFECAFDQNLSGEWTIDIIDNRGAYLENVPIEKVWESECTRKHDHAITKFSVGVKFKNLSDEQQLTVDHLIRSNQSH